MMGFIDTLRAEGYAVESICRVLREQDCQVAARTYRAWKTGRVAARTVTDAQVVDVVRELVWQTDPRTGRLVMAPEGLYGRRKMTALIRRGQLAAADERGHLPTPVESLRRHHEPSGPRVGLPDQLTHHVHHLGVGDGPGGDPAGLPGPVGPCGDLAAPVSYTHLTLPTNREV